MIPTSGPPQIFDAARRLARMRRSAARFKQADFLHVRAAQDAVASLEATLRDFPVVVDASVHPEPFATQLACSEAAARVGAPRPIGAWALAPDTELPLAPRETALLVAL